MSNLIFSGVGYEFGFRDGGPNHEMASVQQYIKLQYLIHSEHNGSSAPLLQDGEMNRIPGSTWRLGSRSAVVSCCSVDGTRTHNQNAAAVGLCGFARPPDCHDDTGRWWENRET
ncbi:hypothetical protein F2P79_021103, partial [Pimephales promelas]